MKSVKWVVYNLSVLYFTLLLYPSALFAASFDCSKASTPIEKMICADPTVGALDEVLASSYKAALISATQSDGVKAQQKVWIHEVRNQCQTTSCLKMAYESRISSLQSTNIGEGALPVVPRKLTQPEIVEQSALDASTKADPEESSPGHTDYAAKVGISSADKFGYKDIKFGMTYTDIAKLGVCDMNAQAEVANERARKIKLIEACIRDVAVREEALGVDGGYRECSGKDCDAFRDRHTNEGEALLVHLDVKVLAKDHYVVRGWFDELPADVLYWDSKQKHPTTDSTLHSVFPPIPEYISGELGLDNKSDAFSECYEIGGTKRVFAFHFTNRHLDSIEISMGLFEQNRFEELAKAIGHQYKVFSEISESDRNLFNFRKLRRVCNLYRDGSVSLCVSQNDLMLDRRIEISYVDENLVPGRVKMYSHQEPKTDEF